MVFLQAAREHRGSHKRYGAGLKSIIMQILHSEAEVDDVLQEVFLQVWDRAPSYCSEKGTLMTWLCTLARRRAIDGSRMPAYALPTATRCHAIQVTASTNRTLLSAKHFVTIFVPCCISTSQAATASATGDPSGLFRGEEPARNLNAHPGSFWHRENAN